MIFESKFQIGKNGVTEGVITALNSNLKTHTQLRISVLKSLTRDKEKIREVTEKIINKLAYKCNYRIIGFTIILKKQSSKKIKHK